MPPIRPPRHIQAPSDLTVKSLLAEHLGVEQSRASWLLAFGAVYMNKERLTEDRPTRAGDWLRIHVEPRRFPADAVDWRQIIVEATDDYVVIDKPAGVPVHPTCDNACENVLARLERELDTRLTIVHRLDIATRGLMALARSSDFHQRFQRALERRELSKRYRALVPRAIPEGEFIHYQAPLDRAPHRMSDFPCEGWRRCAMQVEACTPSRQPGVFEVRIRLLTGRHHQIRAQLATMGAPILGDALYGSDRSTPPGLGEGEVIALQSCELGFPTREGWRSFALPAPW